MGALADALSSSGEGPNRLQVVVDSIEDPDDRAALIAALRDPTVSTHRIFSSLGSVGMTCAQATIRKYRGTITDG